MLLNFLAGLVLAVNGQTYACAPGQVLNYLNITASDVTVSDCQIQDSGPGTNGVTVWGDRNTLSRLLVERYGAAGVYFYTGNGNILEDSLIRDPVTRQGHDSWGVYSAAIGAVTVRRNTVFGSGFSTYAPGGSSLIEENRFIVPADYRTNCQGMAQPNGPCQCAEGGVHLKSGNSVIRGNVMDGYQQSDSICGGSGAPGVGVNTAACNHPGESCPTTDVVIEGNVIRNSRDGIYVSPQSSNIQIQGNLICGTEEAISDGYGVQTSILDNEFADNVVDLNLYGTRTGPVSGNHTVPTLGGCLIGDLLDPGEAYPSRPTIFAP